MPKTMRRSAGGAAITEAAQPGACSPSRVGGRIACW